MRRFYIVPIDRVEADGEVLYRTRLEVYAIQYNGSIPSDPVTGLPLYGEILVSVEVADHRPLRNDPDIIALPDWPVSGKLNGIANAERNAMMAKLAAKGYNTANISATEGYRDTLTEIGLQRDPQFRIDWVDVQ